MWTHKRVYLAPHPAVSLVLQVGDAEKFPQALGFGGLDPFLRVSKQGPRFAATERMEVTKDLYSLNFLVKLMVLHHQILFSLATANVAEAILMRTSAEQVPSLQRAALKYLRLVTFSNFWPFML